MENLIKKLMTRPVPDASVHGHIENPTVQNLAVTPADMAKLVSQGIPVTPANVSSFIDGDTTSDMLIPVDRMRGVDAVDAWEAQMDAKKKFRIAVHNDVKYYKSVENG